MKRTELQNGLIKLECENGIIDKRNGRVYSVVVCKKQDEKWFSERQ